MRNLSNHDLATLLGNGPAVVRRSVTATREGLRIKVREISHMADGREIPTERGCYPLSERGAAVAHARRLLTELAA